MKLACEIIGDKFVYSLEIGMFKIAGTQPYGATEVKFFLDFNDWLYKHTSSFSEDQKADRVIETANHFLKELAIATGNWEAAAKIRQAMKDAKMSIKKPDTPVNQEEIEMERLANKVSAKSPGAGE